MGHDLKSGDRIEIKTTGLVQAVGSPDGAVLFLTDGDHTPTWIDADQLALAAITKLEPELKPGPAVFKSGGMRVEVLAVHGVHAWALWGDGSVCTEMASALRNITEDSDGR